MLKDHNSSCFLHQNADVYATLTPIGIFKGRAEARGHGEHGA